MDILKELFSSGASDFYSTLSFNADIFSALDRIGIFTRAFIDMHRGSDGFYMPCEGVLISRSATVADSALILPPTVILDGTEIRHGAYIRGNCFIGRECVVGNSCELKNCVLFDRACVPHFNYVGDSILGYGAHLGAGAITSNLKLDGGNVVVRIGNELIETKRRKVGALIGDGAEIGCGAVLNPGSVIGAYTTVYPLLSVRGYVPHRSILKSMEPYKLAFKEDRNK